MADRDHVAVGDDVVATLGSEYAALAGGGVAAGLDQLAPPDHLGAHEAGLDVGVDLARRVPGRGAARQAAGSSLDALVGCEERDQAEQVVGGGDEALEPSMRALTATAAAPASAARAATASGTSASPSSRLAT